MTRPLENVEALIKIKEETGDKPDVINEKFRKWQKKSGAEDLFEFFGDKEEDITREDVKKYLTDQKEADTITPFEEELLKEFKRLSNSDTGIQLAANEKVDIIIEYINAKKKTDSESKRHIEQLQLETLETAPMLTGTWNGIKSAMGATAEGFKESSGMKKGVYLAGLGISVVVLYKFLSWAYSTPEGEAKGFLDSKGMRGLKKVLAVGTGGLAAYIGLETVNAVVEKSTGAPLFKVGGEGGGFYFGEGRKERWDKANYDAQIEQVWRELQEANIPDHFLKEYHTDKNKKYMFALSNFMTLTVHELHDLYQ